jgi:WD40 repeat protein
MGASTTHGKFASTVGPDPSKDVLADPVALTVGRAQQATHGGMRVPQLIDGPTREAAGNSNLTLPPSISPPSLASAPPPLENTQPAAPAPHAGIDPGSTVALDPATTSAPKTDPADGTVEMVPETTVGEKSGRKAQADTDATIALPSSVHINGGSTGEDQHTILEGDPGAVRSSDDSGSTTAHDGGGHVPIGAETIGAPVGKVTMISPRTGEVPDASIVQGYEILGVLGRGAMGVVYKARQIGLNRLTALKMILSGAHAGDVEVARFRDEGEAVARLQHPYIVQIYEVGERNGLPFFSLEFVDGGSLQSKLDGAPMGARAAADMTVKLASAMHYAHQRGIVHRDLKPANILMTADGLPKISDFGLAKKLENEAGHTTTGSIMGTPSYMAPEQAAGKTNEIGPPADIYALGAILYEMLVGRPPFRGTTVLDTLQLVQHAEPVPPSRLQPRIPRDLETICLKCLRKEPPKRFESAQELADDLGRFLANQPIKARRVPLWEHGYKWATRHPGVATMLGVLAAVLVGGFILLAGLYANAEHERGVAVRAGKEALEAKNEAELQKTEAQKQEAIAKEAKILAEANSKKEAKAKLAAVEAYQRSLHILYATQMSMTQKAISDGQIRRATDILHKLETENESKNLRGFEWYYLDRLCREPRMVLQGHANLVTNVVFSRDGEKIASSSLDQKVKIWDVKTGQHLKTLEGHARPVRSLAFSDDGKLLATGSGDRTVKVWDVETGKPLQSLEGGHEDLVHSVAFSADGKLLASGGEDRAIVIWEVTSGKLLRKLLGHKYGVTSVAFHPSGDMLVSGGADKDVILWDLSASKLPPQVMGGENNRHGHWVTCVVFDKEGKRVASGSLDETIIVWDVKTHLRLQTLTASHKPIRAVAFSPGEGTQLAAVTQDNSLFVWDLTAAKENPKELEGRPGMLRTIAFSSDGERMGSVTFDTRVWDANTVLYGHTGAVTSVAVHPLGKILASSGGYLDDNSHNFLGEIRLWDLEQPKKLPRRLLGHSGPVRAIAFSSDGKYLLTGGEDEKARLWDVESETVRQVYEHHKAWINAVALQPNGDMAASASEDGKAVLWDLGAKRPPIELFHGGRPVRCVAFSPDGKTLVTGAVGGAVKMWDVATGKEKRAIPNAHQFGTTAVAFSPSGQFLATAGEDQIIRLWPLGDEKLPMEYEGHTDTVTAIVFDETGKRLFSSSVDMTVKVWDTDPGNFATSEDQGKSTTGQETLTLRGHTGSVTCLAIAPDGRRLMSGSWDQTIRIWEAGGPPALSAAMPK